MSTLAIFINVFKDEDNSSDEESYWFWDCELSNPNLFDSPMFEPSEEREYLPSAEAAMEEAVSTALGTTWEWAANSKRRPVEAVRVAILDPTLLDAARRMMGASPFRQKLKDLGLSLFLGIETAPNEHTTELKERANNWFD